MSSLTSRVIVLLPESDVAGFEFVQFYRCFYKIFIATRRLNSTTYIVTPNAILRTCFVVFIYTMYNYRSVLAINVPSRLMTSGLVETHIGFCGPASLGDTLL